MVVMSMYLQLVVTIVVVTSMCLVVTSVWLQHSGGYSGGDEHVLAA